MREPGPRGPRKAVLWLCGERRRGEMSELSAKPEARDMELAPTRAVWLLKPERG